MNSWIWTDDFFPYWMNDHLEFQNPQPINRRKQYFLGGNWLIARGRLRPEGSLQIAGLMSKLPDLPRTLNCKQSGMRFGNVWYLDVGSQAVTCCHTVKSWPQFFWRAVFSSHCAIGWYGAELTHVNIWQRWVNHKVVENNDTSATHGWNGKNAQVSSSDQSIPSCWLGSCNLHSLH